MYFLLKAILRTLLLPPAGPLLLAIAGAIVVGRRRRLGATLLTLGLGSLWLLSLPICADFLSRAAQAYPALNPDQPVEAGAVVILSGGGYRHFAREFGWSGAAADVLLERLTYGAFVAKRQGLPVLISGDLPETWAMRDALRRDFGVDPAWIDYRSLDTYENARHSAALLKQSGVQRVVLVTSAPHMGRAAHEFQAAGLEVVPAPTGLYAKRELSPLLFVPGTPALWHSQMALYEIAGEAVRRVLALTRLREHFRHDSSALQPPS